MLFRSRAPQRLVRRLAGIPNIVGDAVHQLPPRYLASGRRGRPSAERVGLGVPARRFFAADRFLHFSAIKPGQSFAGEIEHRGVALSREIAAESAGDIDET